MSTPVIVTTADGETASAVAVVLEGGSMDGCNNAWLPLQMYCLSMDGTTVSAAATDMRWATRRVGRGGDEITAEGGGGGAGAMRRDMQSRGDGSRGMTALSCSCLHPSSPPSHYFPLRRMFS